MSLNAAHINNLPLIFLTELSTFSWLTITVLFSKWIKYNPICFFFRTFQGPSSYSSTEKLLYPFVLFYPLAFHHVFLYCLFTPDFGNDFSKSAIEPCLKVGTSVTPYFEHDHSQKLVDSSRILGAGVTDSSEFQQVFLVDDLFSEPSTDLIVERAVVSHNDYLLLPYF